tara:strand:+ start:1273 stop:2307 length:1035 start_codon:yes stop_codon:yes gene_type:complete
MARVSIQTELKNITDGASSTVSASLDGTPFTTSTIISSRVFTKASNTSYSIEPYVDFSETSNPSDYTFTRTHNASAGTTTFTVKYRHPLKPPKTDIIRFFGKAKLDYVASTTKIYSYKIKDTNINSKGETRRLTVYGDPNVAFKLDVTRNPKISPESDSLSLIGGEKTILITEDGSVTTPILFPPTTLFTDYRVKLTEVTSGSFVDTLPSPFTQVLEQFPLTTVKLTLSQSASTYTLPSSVTNTYTGQLGSVLAVDFSYTVTKGSSIALDGTFTGEDFTQTDGQGRTLTDELIATEMTYENLKITINNTPTPKTAIITGTLKIHFGYNSDGHTLLSLVADNIIT